MHSKDLTGVAIFASLSFIGLALLCNQSSGQEQATQAKEVMLFDGSS